MIMDWLRWLEDDNIFWNKTSFDLCSPITPVVPRVAIFTVCFLFAASTWNKKWKNPNENVKYEHGMWSHMLYRTIDCSNANVHVDHRDFSLPIILTLLSMIIDNEKAAASTRIILIINVMICIYFVLIWTLSL